MLDPVRVEVLHLNLIMVEKPYQNAIRRHHETTLVEVDERDQKSYRRLKDVLRTRKLACKSSHEEAHVRLGHPSALARPRNGSRMQ